MYESRANGSSGGRGETYRLLSTRRNRRVLAVLAERPDGISLEELAAEIADSTEAARVRVSLHHRHLPKLADASLVAYEDGEVRPGDRLEEDDLVATALAADLDPETADTAFEVLCDRHRRTVIELLATGEKYTVSDLASVVAATSDSDRRGAEVALVHNHLPKLERAGVVEYDDEEVRYCGFPGGEETLRGLLAADERATGLPDHEDVADLVG